VSKNSPPLLNERKGLTAREAYASKNKAMRKSTKERWEEKLINLWKTKDSSLLGEVGEVIAWKYLWAQGLLVWPLWRVMGLHLFSSYLSKEQANYLDGYASRTSATYKRAVDLVGINRRNGQPYLVEVKTTCSDRYRYDSRKFPSLQQRSEAKSIGFKLLLVIVQLIDNWRFRVACKEL